MDAERVAQAILSRSTAIRGLNFDRLASQLEQFDLGYLRDAALTWQKIRDRDDMVKPVAEKRELEAALLNWEILTLEDSTEATRHKKALEDFYNNVSATHALDENQRGGVSVLIRQMMHAVGHKYACHEIVWQPAAEGLRAEFRFVPLQFFENTAGRLRYMPSDHTYPGEELEDGGWMVTVHAGLMEATSIAYLFKNLPLKAQLLFCDKFGQPGLHGETSASPGSEEWNRMRNALANFGQDWALITSMGVKINPIQVNTGGATPHKDMVDRMDRAIARLWRGADLGTMSQEGSAVGSNPQESETDILAAADALIISETLQHYVDRWVIRYRFGVEPLAYFQLQPRTKTNHELELKIDDALIRWGVPRGKKELLARYGRPEPDTSDELAVLSPAPAGALAPGGGAGSAPSFLGNEQAPGDAAFKAASLAKLAPAERAVLEPILRRLAQIATMTDAAAQRGALERFRAALPEVARVSLARVPALAAVWEQVLSPAAVDGWINATKAKKTA